MKQYRLDSALAEKGLSSSREKAKREILAGWVKVDGETVREPSRRIDGDESISVERPGGLFVSRGGDKLRHALDHFGIHLTGRVAVDLGASTGGFTDCMLKAGAAKVFAVDVGYGQLDYSIRTDQRVVTLERRHVNSLSADDFPQAIDFFTADLSFISIIKVTDRIKQLFPGVEGVILVKPQFESMQSEQKKGIVRKREDHAAILRRVCRGLTEKGISIQGCTYSPLKGPKGNIEFLLHVRPGPSPIALSEELMSDYIDTVVGQAHEVLNKTISLSD